MPLLDSDIVMKDLTRQLRAAEMDDDPVVVWVRPNGDVQISTPGAIRRPGREIDADRIAFAADMVRRVNKEAWCDGVWLGVWAKWGMRPDPISGLLLTVPTEFLLMFKDPDGDDHITIGCADNWVVMQAFSADKMIEDAIDGVRRFRGILADVGVKRDQMMSPARGIHGMGAPE